MSSIEATICHGGQTCEACATSGEAIPASYRVISSHLRTLSIYADAAYLCDSHLDILHENMDD